MMGRMALTRDDPLLCDEFLESLAEVDLAAVLSDGSVVDQQEVRVVPVEYDTRTLRCRDRVVRCHNLKYVTR